MLDRAAKSAEGSKQSSSSSNGAGGLLAHVDTLVVDEADLVFSYGYSDDIARLVKELPSVCQSFLMSATLDDDIEKLKSLVLHNPAVVKLEEAHGSGGTYVCDI
jgi:superfamily II DNA/RNA helicase